MFSIIRINSLNRAIIKQPTRVRWRSKFMYSGILVMITSHMTIIVAWFIHDPQWFSLNLVNPFHDIAVTLLNWGVYWDGIYFCRYNTLIVRFFCRWRSTWWFRRWSTRWILSVVYHLSNHRWFVGWYILAATPWLPVAQLLGWRWSWHHLEDIRVVGWWCVICIT